jgi:hypothetical protein
MAELRATIERLVGLGTRHTMSDTVSEVRGIGGDGVHDKPTVRVFSEGTKATETPQRANRRRYNGGGSTRHRATSHA